MENASNDIMRHNRPETGSAQAGASGPTTTSTPPAARKPPEGATEEAKAGTDRTSDPERASGAETATKRKLVDPIAAAEESLRQKEAKLAEKRNSLTQRKRKARNSQLYVWGAMVEAAYLQGSDADRETVHSWAGKYLTEKRHLERSDFGLFRLDKERENTKGK